MTAFLNTTVSPSMSAQTQSNDNISFFDDFDDGVADGWTVELGNFEVIDREYYTENGYGEKSITTVDYYNFINCVVEVNYARVLFLFPLLNSHSNTLLARA